MSNDDWVGRINEVIDSVRSDLATPHTLSDLAERANSSQYHFHRRFVAVTGETPGQFVRRSRLERAAYLMMAAPDQSLIDIALDVGFGDQSDFSRSFSRHYGLAPSKWNRRMAPPVALASPCRSSNPRVRIITRPAMRLATVRIKGIFGLDDLSGGYDELVAWMAERHIDVDRTSLVGMSFDNYRTTPRDRVHYSFGFAVADSVNGDGSVYIRSLPAFTAAAIEIDGGLGEMARSWDHLYDQWFPDRPWTPVDLPALKLFHRRPDEVGWHNFQLDCAVPFRAG